MKYSKQDGGVCGECVAHGEEQPTREVLSLLTHQGVEQGVGARGVLDPDLDRLVARSRGDANVAREAASDLRTGQTDRQMTRDTLSDLGSDRKRNTTHILLVTSEL